MCMDISYHGLDCSMSARVNYPRPEPPSFCFIPGKFSESFTLIQNLSQRERLGPRRVPPTVRIRPSLRNGQIPVQNAYRKRVEGGWTDCVQKYSAWIDKIISLATCAHDNGSEVSLVGARRKDNSKVVNCTPYKNIQDGTSYYRWV
jgi:hypothetical protein